MVFFSVESSENNSTNLNESKEILNVERTSDDMKIQIKNQNTAKPTTYNNIPAKILVEYCDIYAYPIHRLYNHSTLNGTFPDKCSRDNYRPISILSSLSKFFEKIMHDDISVHEK